MKIYRNMKSIVGNNLIYLFLIGIFLPVVLWHLRSLMLVDKSPEVATLSAVMFLLIICCIGYSIYLLYVLLVHLWGMRKHTIEITTSGIHYPYLLRDNLEITWKEIKKFEYVIDTLGENTTYYIIVELQQNVDVQPFNKVPGIGLINTLQKKYDHQILVFFEDIIKGHSLSDLADYLNAERKYAVEPPIFINQNPVLYQMIGAPLHYVIKAVALSCVAFLLVLMSVFIFNLQSFYSKMIIVILAVMIGLIVLKFLSDRIANQVQPPIALRFDQDGITVLNGQKFLPPIPWSNIQHLEIRKRIKSSRQRPKELFLLIEVIDIESDEVKSYEINNDLQDTSVYEVMSSLKHYWR